MKPKISFENVSKSYSVHRKQIEKLFSLFRFKKKQKEFFAINNVSFEVQSGESIGVVGINGSGKSTLSNLLGQVVEPTSGKVYIDGESSLIAISAGLNNNLTGIENIELKCLMLGMNMGEIKEIIPDIIEFADIGEFVYQPVKNYSSGMKSRLGFAVSAHTNPDILIIDEALSVGDSTFYEKCIKKINEFKAEGKTIFFISHSIGQIRSFSDRVMWLHFGEMVQFGETSEVLEEYKKFIGWFNDLPDEEKKAFRKERLGNQYSQKIKNSRVKPKQKRKWGSTIVSTLFLFIIGLLILGTGLNLQSINVVKGIATVLPDRTEPDTSNETKNPVEEITIDKSGYMNEQTQVFEDEELHTSISTLEFFTPVEIIKEKGDVYQIDTGKETGYVKKSTASIAQKKEHDYGLRDLLTILPDEFATSYDFFMTHLDMPYDEVKEGLMGLTGTTTDDEGRKVLEYDYDKIFYTFEEESKPLSITVKDINVNSLEFDGITSAADVKNDEKGLYGIYLKGYKVTIDKEKETATLQPIEQS